MDTYLAYLRSTEEGGHALKLIAECGHEFQDIEGNALKPAFALLYFLRIEMNQFELLADNDAAAENEPAQKDSEVVFSWIVHFFCSLLIHGVRSISNSPA